MYHHQHRTFHVQQWGPYPYPQQGQQNLQIHPGNVNNMTNITRSGSPNSPIYVTNCAAFPVLTLEQFQSPPPYYPVGPNGDRGYQVESRQRMNLKVCCPSPGPGPSFREDYKKSAGSNYSYSGPSQSKLKAETIVKNEPEEKVPNTQKIKEDKPVSSGGDNFTEDTSIKKEIKTEDSQDSENRGLKRQHDSVLDEKNATDSLDSQAKRRFLLKTPEKVETPKSPSHLIDVKEEVVFKDAPLFQELSEVIWKVYLNKRQSEETFTKKIRLRDALFEFLKKLFPTCGLYIVGSSLTGLGANGSDLDMCIMLYPHEIRQEVQAIKILKIIAAQAHTCPFMDDPQVIFAKVPILKFQDRVSGIDVDLNVNSAVGIRNTQLLNCYSRLDHRLAPLSIIVKLWAKQHDINDARNMTLSSYSLILMLIHYLQCGCNPPVLICLQKAMPDKFHPESDVRQLILREEIPNFVSQNKENFGQLFLGFLNYYGNIFDFDRNVISVRLGTVLPKNVAMNCQSPNNNTAQWKFICIEEPFSRTNTARSVFEYNSFQRIKKTFKTSYNTLLETKILSSILNISGT